MPKATAVWTNARFAGAALLVGAALCACGGRGAGGANALPADVAGSVARPAATAVPSPEIITVDVAHGAPAVSEDLIGASLATWSDITQPYVAQTFAAIGLHAVRWPGGSESDAYHWANGGTICDGQGYVYPPSTFDNFMKDDAIPAKLDVSITLDYGSNAACNAGGDPTEAAAWVGYAKSKAYAVRRWTVGNEVYGSWEYDLHAVPHDPATYAAAVATGYYPKIKAADPTAQVGVVVAGSSFPAWDPIVLKKAKYDFVEFHYYAQAPGAENDRSLIGPGINTFANTLRSLRAEMTSLGVSPSIPIYVGELNTVYTNPGKQTVSIVNGLFAGMAVAEMMRQSGVDAATWWIGYGGCDTSGNDSGSVYGWQNFGTYTLFSDGGGECGSNIPAGTAFPDARAYALLSQFAPAGSTMRNVSGTNLRDVRAYADTSAGRYALLLFNTDDSAPSRTFVVQITGATKSSFAAAQTTYGKAQYDESKTGVWAAPVKQSLGTVKTTFDVVLPAWSMSLVTLQ